MSQCKTFVVIIEGVPSQIFESAPLVRDFLEAECRYAVSNAIDAHDFAQIAAADPPQNDAGQT